MNGIARKIYWFICVASLVVSSACFGQGTSFAVFDKTAVVQSNADIAALPPHNCSLEDAFVFFARERGIDYTGKYRFAIAEIRPQNGLFAEAAERAFAEAFAEASKEIEGTVSTVMTRQDCKSGVWRVGVVVRNNDNMSELLREVASGRKVAGVAEKGIPIAALLSGDAISMTQELGLRFFYDERGVPALISFAQVDLSDAGQNPLERLRLRNASLQAAVAKSEKNMRDFLLQHKFPTSATFKCIYREILRHPIGREIVIAASLWTFDAKTSSLIGPLRVKVGEEYDF